MMISPYQPGPFDWDSMMAQVKQQQSAVRERIDQLTTRQAATWRAAVDNERSRLGDLEQARDRLARLERSGPAGQTELFIKTRRELQERAEALAIEHSQAAQIVVMAATELRNARSMIRDRLVGQLNEQIERFAAELRQTLDQLMVKHSELSAQGRKQIEDLNSQVAQLRSLNLD